MYNIAEITINYKPSPIFSPTSKITTSNQAYEILKQNWENITYKESFKILLLNSANVVIGISLISIGGTSATFVDPKIIFQTALKSNASYILLAHNHPSGALKPSDQDKILTNRIVQVGKLLGLLIIDHLILSEEKYYSFGDDGLI